MIKLFSLEASKEWDEVVQGEEIYEEVDVLDAEGKPTGEKQLVPTGRYKEETIHHKELVTPEKTQQVWVVDEKGHYEYEKGWRDGDFHYKG